MGTLIDTSVLIAAQRAAIDFDALLAAQGNQDIAVATISASELMHGPHRMTNAVARARAERAIDTLLDALTMIDFDLEIARLHARLGADLAANRTAVGAHDLIIAATALSLDYRIATRDKRSFPRIPGLDVVYW